jgi:hypothetical protein
MARDSACARSGVKGIAPVSDCIRWLDSERFARGLVELARAKKFDRLLVAGDATNDIGHELRRCGFRNTFTTKTCGLPRGQYHVAMVAWGDHSIKALETTLDWLVHFVSATGTLVVWLGSPDLGAHQKLRRALDRLGFRIEMGSRIEHGIAVCARRVAMVRAAKAA